MILEKQTEANILQEGQSQESIGMSLDLDSAQILMQMLSKNLYSDSIGSTVRECASNALDSHRRAGVNKPIVVSLGIGSNNNYEFSVEDFGIGLDADDVKNIISKYGKSTKRNSNTELGMMGLGFKAPLAYTSAFYFVARKNGMERKYMMYEGEDTNTIDLLYETSTTEGNGVKVIVPIKDRWDKSSFERKIQEQLAYFQDVYIISEGMKNDFKIYRTEHFQFSEIATDRNLHLCLDDVYYPLDFGKLGIQSISFPVALRFGLSDAIFPTPNRESIRYTEEAKRTILNKIKEVANFFVERFNTQTKETEDIIALFEYFQNTSRYVTLNGKNMEINALLDYATVPVNHMTLKGIKHLDLERVYRVKDYLFKEYSITHEFKGGRMYAAVHKYTKDITYWKWSGNKFYINDLEKMDSLMKDYLRSTNNYRAVICKKVDSFKLGNDRTTDYSTYHSMLELRKHPKSQWRTLIQEFQLIVGMIVKMCTKLSDVKIPDEFIKSRELAKVKVKPASVTKTNRRIKVEGILNFKKASKLEKWVSGKSCKFVPGTYEYSTLHRVRKLNVYAKYSQSEQMDKLYTPFSGTVDLYIVTEREYDNLNKLQLHNWITYEKFMEGKTKPFSRAITAELIKELFEKNQCWFSKSILFKEISTDLYNKIEKVNKYRIRNTINLSVEFYQSALEVAKQSNLLDPEIYTDYLELKKIVEKYTFVNPLLSSIPRYELEKPEYIQPFIDLFKYHKHRIDWKHYNIRMNEDVLLEAPITEETIESSLY